MATSAVDAAKAGAAILHLHARDPSNGQPSQEPAMFDGMLAQLKSSTTAVITQVLEADVDVVGTPTQCEALRT